MKLSPLRTYALTLADVTEEPHHQYSSWRVHGKIFVTIPPDEQHVHVFTAEEDREQMLAMYPDFTEKLLWGGKVVGLKVHLDGATPAALKAMVHAAWQYKASRKSASR